MTSNQRRTGCVPCPAGSASLTFSGCFKCALGENVGVTGSLVCLVAGAPCPKNFFRRKTGGCDTCEKGERFAKKASRCIACKPNETSAGGTSTKCKRCGQLQTRNFDGECECQDNAVLRPNGRCRVCPAGQIAGRYATTTSPEPIFEKGCETCPDGTFSDKPGLTKCKPCPDGMVSRANRKGCQKCPKGLCFHQIPVMFEDHLGPGMCVVPTTNCPPGFERRVDANGVLLRCQQVPCPPDTFANMVDAANTESGEDELECVSCPAGSFIDSIGVEMGQKIGCSLCDDGAISPGGIVFKCEQCPNGRIQHSLPEGFGVRCGCREDIFHVRALFDGMCVFECPGGYFVKNQGPFKDLVCEKCPAGTFRLQFEDFSCRLCPVGSFTDQPGTEECEECPPGTTTLKPGATKCVPG